MILLVSFRSFILILDNADFWLGGSICGAFVFFGVLSVLLYKPWRRQVDRRRAHLVPVEEEPVANNETTMSLSDEEVIAGTSFSAIGEVEVVTVQVDGKK